MAEETTPHGEQGENDQDGKSAETQATDWKAEARKWEQRAKDNKARADANDEAARKLAGIEDANKTAETKTAERITALEKQLADSQRAALVARVQASHGISDEDAALFLTGSDEDALTAQAKRLAERADEQKKNGNRAPKEGGTTTTSDGKEDLRTFARNLFGAAQNE